MPASFQQPGRQTAPAVPAAGLNTRSAEYTRSMRTTRRPAASSPMSTDSPTGGVGRPAERSATSCSSNSRATSRDGPHGRNRAITAPRASSQ